MALFKRKKTESVMPEEVRDFYAAERRQRKGTAWLLAIATLLVTFLIAAALFFGGRWVYRAIFGNDNDKTSTTQGESADKRNKESTQSSNSNDQSTNSTGSTGNSGGANNSSTNQSSSSGSQSANGGTGSSSSNAGSRAPQSVPNTGPNELVNTGPGDENW